MKPSVPPVRRRSRQPLSAINILPLLDVLLLLIAALLINPQRLTQALPVELPRTTLTGRPVLQSSIRLILEAGGTVRWNGQRVTAATLGNQVRSGITTIEIAPATHATYGDIASLVEALQELAPREIVLLTQ